MSCCSSNDTEPTTGWLDNLIDAFGRFVNVGLAGSKLLYPDGSLQDAGGIIWGLGEPMELRKRRGTHGIRVSVTRVRPTTFRGRP